MDINDPILPGTLLADLRDREDYDAGHIPGAKCMALDELLRKDPAAPVVLYCYRGIRSARAAMIMKIKGFKNVRSVGGIDRYKGKLEKT